MVRLGLAVVVAFGCGKRVDPIDPVSPTVPTTRPLPRDPIAIAPFQPGSNCDLVLDQRYLYWLEKGVVGASSSSPAIPGYGGAVRMCGASRGALRRTSRARAGDRASETVAELDYWPFGLVQQGTVLYWTGAACSGSNAT